MRGVGMGDLSIKQDNKVMRIGTRSRGWGNSHFVPMQSFLRNLIPKFNM